MRSTLLGIFDESLPQVMVMGYELHDLHENALGGGMNNGEKMDDAFYGTATVGERGQLVIPAEARNDLGIRPGDKLLIMKHPVYQGLMIAKIEALKGFLDEFSRGIDRLHEGTATVPEEG